MTTTNARADVSLVEVLVQRARGASDRRLALDVAAGLLGALAAARWQPPGWPLVVAAALCFFAFGAWGIADRELSDLAPGGVFMVVLLRSMQVLAVATAIGASLILVSNLLLILLGTWIS